jgi:hypothetical protein
MLKEEHFHGGQGSRGGWDAPFSYDYIAERLGFPGSNAAKLAVNRFEKASFVSNDTSCSNVQTAA